jgi:hypothetical protein
MSYLSLQNVLALWSGNYWKRNCKSLQAPRSHETTAPAVSLSVNSESAIRGFVLRFCVAIVAAVCWLAGTFAQAQSGLPPHGKIKMDSYNYLLRDVHPASQAQANYLQNRLFTSGLKKHERLERQERLDVYGERKLVQLLDEYQDVARGLAAGRTVSATRLSTFWMLVSAYGDRTEVYDALSSQVPPIAHEDFVPTSRCLQVLEPNGKLKQPPLLLSSVDASDLTSAWNTIAIEFRAAGHLSASEAARFCDSVAEYRRLAKSEFETGAPAGGRFDANKYVDSLASLADSLYRPQLSAQVEQYIRQGGYAYYGRTMLGMVQHMVRNRVTPAQGSTAQIALAEVARPICAVLEQEISIHLERTDSLAAAEGHRPYASEYRPFDKRDNSTAKVTISL